MNLLVLIYVTGWIDTRRVKCPAQDHNAMTSARVPTLIASCGIERCLRQLILPASLGKLLVFSPNFDPGRGTSFNCFHGDHFYASGIREDRICQVWFLIS